MLDDLEALTRETEALELAHKETWALVVTEADHQEMVAERDLGREEVKLMEEQVRLRAQGLEKMIGVAKEVEQAVE